LRQGRGQSIFRKKILRANAWTARLVGKGFLNAQLQGLDFPWITLPYNRGQALTPPVYTAPRIGDNRSVAAFG